MYGVKMKSIILVIITLLITTLVLISSPGCVNNANDTHKNVNEVSEEPTESLEYEISPTKQEQNTSTVVNETEIIKGIDHLYNFLKLDKTDRLNTSASEYAKILSINASKHGYDMGTAVINPLGERANPGIGGSYFVYILNYCIIDNRIVFIEPQNDIVYTLPEIVETSDYPTQYDRISLYTNPTGAVNAEWLTKRTADIKRFYVNDEQSIIERFRPLHLEINESDMDLYEQIINLNRTEPVEQAVPKPISIT